MWQYVLSQITSLIDVCMSWWKVIISSGTTHLRYNFCYIHTHVSILLKYIRFPFVYTHRPFFGVSITCWAKSIGQMHPVYRYYSVQQPIISVTIETKQTRHLCSQSLLSFQTIQTLMYMVISRSKYDYNLAPFVI